MARKPGVYWDPTAESWRSNVGEFSDKNGRRKPVYFRGYPNTDKGKRAAAAELAAFLAERDRLEAERRQDRRNPRVLEGVVLPWLDHLNGLVERDECSPKTLKSHRERIKRFIQFAPGKGPHARVKLGDRLAASLSDDDLALFVVHLRETGCGARRVDGVLRSVDACFNWAARPVAGRDPKRILPENPFAGFERPAVPKRKRTLPTRLDVARLLRAGRAEVEAWTPISGRCAGCVRAKRYGGRCRRSHNQRAVNYRLVLLLCRLQAACGTRPDELCRATWLEVKLPGEPAGVPGWDPRAHRDPETGHWWGLLTVFGKTSRVKGELRRIAVPPVLARAIERVRAMGLDPEWIFPRLRRSDATGRAVSGRWEPTALASRVRRWRERAGLSPEFVLYALRHAVYTRAVHVAGLTADQAGLVGGTGAATVRSTYLHADTRAIFEGARRIRRARLEGLD
jgi:integrase